MAESRVFYYARVSTREQHLDRQISAFLAMGAAERDIIVDRASGKDLKRDGYTALKTAMLRRGRYAGHKIAGQTEPQQGRHQK